MNAKEAGIAFAVVIAMVLVLTLSIENYDEGYSPHGRLVVRNQPVWTRTRARGPKPRMVKVPETMTIPTPMVTQGPPASSVVAVDGDEEGQRGGGPPAWAMQRGNKFGLKRRLGVTESPVVMAQNPAAAEDMDRAAVLSQRSQWKRL